LLEEHNWGPNPSQPKRLLSGEALAEVLGFRKGTCLALERSIDKMAELSRSLQKEKSGAGEDDHVSMYVCRYVRTYVYAYIYV
jgi:hypothetical protein